MYNYNHLTFLSDVTPQSKSIRFIKIDGVTSHIITKPNCVIRIIKNTLEIKQEHDNATIILDFLNPTVTKIAHDRLREALKQLTYNNTTDQNNIVKAINLGPISVELVNDWDIDENQVMILINNFFSTYTIIVNETENILFNISINYYSDISDVTTFKFAQIRKYIFLRGKGTYLNDITINDLELLNIDNGYKFIDLYDIDLSNKNNLLLTVNSTEDGLEYKSLSEIAGEGFETEYVIDLSENTYLDITLNSKLQINGIEQITGDISSLTINGSTPVFPIIITTNPSNLIFSCNDNCIFNLKIIKYIL